MVANILTDLTDWIDEIASYWWFPLVVFAIALLDSVIPIVPSETTVIAGGVAAGAGNQSLAVIILAGAAGAFIGDNLAYMIGHRFEPRVNRWAAKKPERLARLAGAAAQIKRRGGPLLITARFIPGGRTVLTVSCGLTAQPRRWFAFWIAIAAVDLGELRGLPRLRVRQRLRGQLDAGLPAGVRRRAVDHGAHRTHPVGPRPTARPNQRPRSSMRSTTTRPTPEHAETDQGRIADRSDDRRTLAGR